MVDEVEEDYDLPPAVINEFAYTWNIKDFVFCTEEQLILSDVFKIKTFLNSQWYLSLRFYKEHTVISLVLANLRNRRKGCKFGYRIEMVSANKIISNSCNRARLFVGGSKKFTIPHKDSLLRNREYYLTNNNLTFTCTIWDRLFNMVEDLSSSFISEVNVDFSSFETVILKEFKAESFTAGENFCSEQNVTPFTFRLSLRKGESVNEALFTVIYTEMPKIFVCGSVNVLNASGQTMAVEKFQHYFFNRSEVDFSFDKLSALLNDTDIVKELNNFSLKFLLKTPVNTLKISPPLYSWSKFSNSSNNLSLHSNIDYVANLPPKKAKRTFHLTPVSFADGLRTLYRENKFPDCILKIENNNLPVHKIVLYCRSPVFQKMFESDMKEKLMQSARISDVGLNTMKLMLDFMYLDTFSNNITLEDALKLYGASNKYLMQQLKKHCMEFLKSILNNDNLYDILLLSHLYSDFELESAIQKHLIDNVDIFGTQKWNEFSKEHISIASKLMQDYILSKHSMMPPHTDISGIEKVNLDADQDLVSALRQSYLENNFCDCLLHVGNSHFPIHSVVLHARSEVLSTLFHTAKFNETLETKDVTLSDSFEPHTIECMIHFMYFDAIEFTDWQKAIEMYVVSSEYQFIALRDTCVMFLASNITTDNICQVLTLVDTHQDMDLKAAVENFISSNPNLVFRSSGWKDVYKTCPRLAGEIMMNYLSEN